MTAVQPRVGVGAMLGSIAIGIITYNRPEKLSLLLAAVDRQKLPEALDSRIRIVLVDNSAESSAQHVAQRYAKDGRFSLDYISETRKGLSTARNAVLNAAMSCSDAVAFIDDDEIPVENWIASLVTALEDTGATAAVGPIRPVFEDLVPNWIAEGQYFAKRLESKDGFVQDGYTCNAIVRTSFLKEKAILFDSAFNQTGGEDTHFFADLKKAGGSIAWAENAVVLEWIPSDRAQAAWLARRWFRTGGTEARLGRLGSASLLGRGYNFMRGCLRIAAGSTLFIACLPAFWFVPRKVARTAKMACRGAGLVASALGREHQEYAHQSYR